MKCLKCQKEIPENSIYCLFCGNKVATLEEKGSEYFPPVYIDYFSFSTKGPIKDEQGKNKYGYETCLVLRDKNGNSTTANGKVLIHAEETVVFGKKFNASFNFQKEDFQESGNKEIKHVLYVQKIEPLIPFSTGFFVEIDITTDKGVKLSKWMHV